jgi:hypothetical protein
MTIIIMPLEMTTLTAVSITVQRVRQSV